MLQAARPQFAGSSDGVILLANSEEGPKCAVKVASARGHRSASQAALFRDVVVRSDQANSPAVSGVVNGPLVVAAFAARRSKWWGSWCSAVGAGASIEACSTSVRNGAAPA